MKLKEWCKVATKKELEEHLIATNETFIAFDKFLEKELGEVTYNDIVKKFAINQSDEWLRKLGMVDSEIEKFHELMGEKEEVKS